MCSCSPLTFKAVPLGGEAHPTLLDKEDELQRLSELQKRDSLVRGLGIPEILQCMFADSRTKISSEEDSVSDVRTYIRTCVCTYVCIVLCCDSAQFTLSCLCLTDQIILAPSNTLCSVRMYKYNGTGSIFVVDNRHNVYVCMYVHTYVCVCVHICDLKG